MAESQWVGHEMECPHCNQLFIVPDEIQADGNAAQTSVPDAPEPEPAHSASARSINTTGASKKSPETLIGKAKQHQILICEDDLNMVEIISNALKVEGYAVTNTYNGAEALELITAKPHFYDLLLVDHVMPILNGLGLVRVLRRLKFAGKILVHSGYVDSQIRREYENLAVDGIMIKPYYLKALLDSVETVLRNAQVKSELR